MPMSLVSLSPSVKPYPFPMQLPALTDTIGTFLIGTALGLILLGINLHLAWTYARTYPGDSVSMKCLVALVVVLELLSSGMSMQICYWRLVTNYFHPESLPISTWPSNLLSTVAGVTMVTSQSYFARRVWLLEPRYRVIVMFSCLCYVAELGCLVAGSTIQFITNDSQNKVALRLIPASLCLALVADVLLTISLIYILHRKRTGFGSTDTVIDILILYAVNTGLLTGVFDLLTAILALLHPDNLVYMVFAIPATKLYGITLLAALHTRRTVRDRVSAKHQDADVFGVSFSPPPAIPNAGLRLSSQAGRTYTNELSSSGSAASDPSVIDIRAMETPPSSVCRLAVKHASRDKTSAYDGSALALRTT